MVSQAAVWRISYPAAAICCRGEERTGRFSIACSRAVLAQTSSLLSSASCFTSGVMQTSLVIVAAAVMGRAGRLRLDQSHRQPLVQGGEQKAVHALQKAGNILPAAQKMYAVGKAQPGGLLAHFVQQRAGARQQQGRCREPACG